MFFFNKRQKTKVQMPPHAPTYITKSRYISVPIIMRRYKIGSCKAASILDRLCELHYIAPASSNTDVREMLVNENIIWDYITYNYNFTNSFSSNFPKMYTNIDPLLEKAGKLCIINNKGSISMIQRELRIGFNQASHIMDQLYQLGVVGPEEINKPRNVLIDLQKFNLIISNINNNVSLNDIITSHTSANDHTNKDFDLMDGHEFEYFCADLLKQNGFSNVVVTQGSSDDGIDILAEKEDIKYGIQCKCYSSNIGNSAVQQAYTGIQMYKCDVGVVLTNRFFTESAKKTSDETRIKLWDRKRLEQLINVAKNHT